MIIVVQNIPYLADALRSFDEVLSVPYTDIDNELLKRTGCTSLFVRTTTKVYHDLLDGTNVRFVGTATSGVDHLDLEYLNEHDIYYASAAGSNANAVAEYAIFDLLSQITLKGRSIRDTVVGVIGYGHIGKLVTSYCRSLGLRVLVNDPPLEHSPQQQDLKDVEFTDLETLLRESHIISNHIPLTREGQHPTENLLSRERLNMVQPNAHLIHTSRGGILDEQALLALMLENKLSATLDVWAHEPLYTLDLARRCVAATPHVSGHSDDGIIVAAERLLQEFEAFTKTRFDHTIITRHKSLGRRTIDSFTDVNEVIESLRPTVRAAALSEQLRHPPDESPETLRRYFMQLRMAYKGRPEILTV